MLVRTKSSQTPRVPRTLERYWNKSILGERLGGGTRPMFADFTEKKGAEGGDRTRTGLRPQDFKSCVP